MKFKRCLLTAIDRTSNFGPSRRRFTDKSESEMKDACVGRTEIMRELTK